MTHFSDERMAEICSKSLINCHAVGMNSVVFDEGPGKSAKVRMFICEPHHTLWANRPPFSRHMSIAVHSHHCAVRLHGLFGSAWNVLEESTPFYRLRGWSYQSAISAEQGSFVPSPSPDLVCNFTQKLIRDEPMAAAQRHTVYVPRGESAAWMVYEGAEDSDYDSTCYSVADLRNFDFGPLYKPMTMEVLEKHLALLEESSAWLLDLLTETAVSQ